MNARAALLTAALATLAGSSALAHESHRHEAPRTEIGEALAQSRAQEELQALVKAQKLDASWQTAGKFKSLVRKGSPAWEWLATFENATVADPSKQTLYVFLKPSGEFVAANFTGK